MFAMLEEGVKIVRILENVVRLPFAEFQISGVRPC
jgi:hypothetical protein